MCLTSTEGPNVYMMLLIITQCPDSSKSGMPSGVENVIPLRAGKRECFWANLQYEREDTGVRLIEEILSDSNISEAIRRGKSNKLDKELESRGLHFTSYADYIEFGMVRMISK